MAIPAGPTSWVQLTRQPRGTARLSPRAATRTAVSTRKGRVTRVSIEATQLLVPDVWTNGAPNGKHAVLFTNKTSHVVPPGAVVEII